MTEDRKAEVYFDGACPLCRREIAFYRRQRGAERIAWVDASAPDAALGPDLDRERALGRFHVRLEDGRLAHGGDGFLEIWRRLDRFRWLARLIGGAPGGRWVINRA
ncbi:MAG: DUF393 domain-containing protein [Pseudomonadota bacterium]